MSLLRNLIVRFRATGRRPAPAPSTWPVDDESFGCGPHCPCPGPVPPPADALIMTRAHAHLGTARRHLMQADRAATQWIATDNPDTAHVYEIALIHQLGEAQAAIRAALAALQEGQTR
ncbi:hypothetical protein [Nocardiopsis protaetiae]|uniref:hypothetical protein n=1 Tax=Nocardiopsis protaetiae TaxID=3382270 RepID=UPI00387B1ABD